MKTTLRGTLLRLAVSLASIAAVAYVLRDKLDEALHILRHDVSWPCFSVVCVVYLAGLIVISMRMKYVFRVQQLYIGFRESFYLGCIGLFFNLFFPSAIGGDVAKAYFVYKHTGKKIESLTSVILDRLMGFVAMSLMAVVALFLFSKELGDPRIDRLIYVFMGFMLLVVCFLGSRHVARAFGFLRFLLPSERAKAKCRDIYYAFYGYKYHMHILVFSIVLSLLAQSLFVVAHYGLAYSLGLRLNLWIFFIVVPIIAIVSMAPSLGGLGVREAGAIYLFSRFMSPEQALAMSILIDLILYGFSFLSGILFSLKGGLRAKTIHEMEELE
ncbi:MAG: lysylphosphatidylglycerol synthase transmembrane domain-containing protein [Candidatus Omnitrophota bacterium]|jgi:hypothetical protein